MLAQYNTSSNETALLGSFFFPEGAVESVNG